MSQIYKPFLMSFGVREEFDRSNNITYLIKKTGTSHKSIILFLTGIGLDYSDFFIPFVLSSSQNILVAPTVPGFESDYKGNILTIADQAKKIAQFIKNICSEHNIYKLKIYGFSFGSDLTISILDYLLQYHKISRPRIEKVIMTEVNVDEGSCFITNKIKETEKHEISERHTHFFFDVLKACQNKEINNMLLSDLSLYYSKIISKSWVQLVEISKEVTKSPQTKLKELIKKTEANNDIPFYMIFSDLRDRLTYESTLKEIDPYGRIKNVKIVSIEGGHFSHVQPEGIIRNLELV